MRYYLTFALIWIITLPPLRILYLFSDLLFLLIYYVFRYRKNVVMGNLELVFPNKSPVERKQIAKKFYRHFSDHIIESFKLIHFFKADLNRHFTYHNIELLNNLMDQGHSLILVSGHIGNWEWMVNIQSHLRHKYLAIYKPLASKSFDRLVKYLRSKYAEDGELVAMKDIYKRLLELRKENVKSITWFLADQSPPGGYPVRKKFFGVETPVYSGPAKLAKRFNYSIIYLEITKQ
jgi:Kdo2-lipid IVA lauroyltransferase/acyltransferase